MNRFCTCSCAPENDYILALEVLLEATSVLMSLRHGAYNRLHVIDRLDRPNWRKCYTSIKHSCNMNSSTSKMFQTIPPNNKEEILKSNENNAHNPHIVDLTVRTVFFSPSLFPLFNLITERDSQYTQVKFIQVHE